MCVKGQILASKFVIFGTIETQLCCVFQTLFRDNDDRRCHPSPALGAFPPQLGGWLGAIMSFDCTALKAIWQRAVKQVDSSMLSWIAFYLIGR